MPKQAKNELLTSLKQQRDSIEHQIATLEREIMLQNIAGKCENEDFYAVNIISSDNLPEVSNGYVIFPSYH